MSAAVDALQRACDAEHAAIYAYGVIGARLTGAAQRSATTADTAHRRQRDAVTDLLIAAGATPRPAAPAYTVPRPVTDAASAMALAVEVEERVATVWRATLGRVSGPARVLAVDALTGSAVRAAVWRRLTRPDATPVVPFPGEG